MALAPTTQQFLDDPHAVYAELRATQPVFWDEPRGLWLITGYDEVREAQRRIEDFSNAGWELERFMRLPAEIRAQCPTLEQMLRTPVVVQSDAPVHTRLRGLVNRSFTPRAIDARRAWLREMTDELLDTMSARDLVDLGSELAYPVPIRAIVQLFGGVPDDIPLYKEVSSMRLVWGGSPRVDAELTLCYEVLLREFRAYLCRLWERRDAGDTLLATLLARDRDGDAMTEDELFHACMVFLSAGHETTTSLIGAAILALMAYPEQERMVRDDPSLVPALVEEALRWASPVQRTQRIAARNFDFHGRQIRRGDLISLVLAGANRDPQQFARPDVFDIARPDGKAHVALGHGIHFCVGAGLARTESAIALEALLERTTAFELAGEPRYAASLNVRLVDSLPARVVWR